MGPWPRAHVLRGLGFRSSSFLALCHSITTIVFVMQETPLSVERCSWMRWVTITLPGPERAGRMWGAPVVACQEMP